MRIYGKWLDYPSSRLSNLVLKAFDVARGRRNMVRSHRYPESIAILGDMGYPGKGKLPGVLSKRREPIGAAHIEMNTTFVSHEQRHIPLKNQFIGWVSRTIFDRATYRQRHGRLKGLLRQGGLGWLPVQPPRTREDDFWDSLNVAGKVVYDVGAFHGLISMHLARTAAHVIAFEPHPKNRRVLQTNVELNKFRNVEIRPYALSRESGTASMYQDPAEAGTARIVVNGERERLETVLSITLDDFIRLNSAPFPDFIKIDTEGHEAAVLEGAAGTLWTHHPELFLELHGSHVEEKRYKTRLIVHTLNKLSYNRIVHIESGEIVNPEIHYEGHLHALSL